jgi:hypothetical protein
MRTGLLQLTLLAVIGLAIISSWLAGTETEAVLDVKSLHEKREVMIPMRDDVKTFYGRLFAERYIATLSDPADPHRIRH